MEKSLVNPYYPYPYPYPPIPKPLNYRLSQTEHKGMTRFYFFHSCNDGVTGTKCDESPTFFRAGRKRAEQEHKENYLAMLRKEILAKQALHKGFPRIQKTQYALV